MNIEDRNGSPINSFDDWAVLYETPQQSHQWKEHRSAWSMADFMMQRDGASHLQARLDDMLGQPITLERAVPEFEQRFDSFGRGRVHDLAIFGKSADGRSVFVGVEAKVDESFGPTVHDSYLQSKANQITGISTNAPERIEQLLKLHFSKPDPSMFDVRYQLLYATAGTLAAEADISVLYVVVFKTPLYNESIGADNYRDYIHFVNKVGGSPVMLAEKSAAAHALELDGRDLLCIHEYFDLR
jgi:hypothetical protein